ncbi:hypothetical protein SLEP1_g25307 [Rubroshorea leprosula]|uniref:Response regulatory domain-containing protein n=1 Tax=Rubroshorea leprosula TaxID=152421 RepID=A0AAV5JIA2_9ROSI|nr:hypothetical protein SLEP1_g25307 [Rubroshorea leprosula]
MDLSSRLLIRRKFMCWLLMIASLIGKLLKGCSEFLLVKVCDQIRFRLNEVWLDCAVTAVDSGRRALQFLGLDEEKSNTGFQDLKVDLIITDYCMPGMTGYELLKKIKESSAFRETPVVIMSSENVLARIDRCLEEGAEDFIVKPVKLSDVKRLKDYMTREVRDRGVIGNREKGINKRKQRDCSDDLSSPPSSPPSVSSSPSSSSSPPSASPSPSPSPSILSSSAPCSVSILDSPTRRLKMINSDRSPSI